MFYHSFDLDRNIFVFKTAVMHISQFFGVHVNKTIQMKNIWENVDFVRMTSDFDAWLDLHIYLRFEHIFVIRKKFK